MLESETDVVYILLPLEGPLLLDKSSEQGHQMTVSSPSLGASSLSTLFWIRGRSSEVPNTLLNFLGLQGPRYYGHPETHFIGRSADSKFLLEHRDTSRQ